MEPPLEFLEKLKNVSILLQESENLLRSKGIRIPEQNIVVESNKKIKIPRGYIRTVDALTEKYKLNRFNDKNLLKNIAYHLQFSDFINYLSNRFAIGLSVEKIFYKFAIINTFSIIEALLKGIAKELN